MQQRQAKKPVWVLDLMELLNINWAQQIVMVTNLDDSFQNMLYATEVQNLTNSVWSDSSNRMQTRTAAATQWLNNGLEE